MDRSPLVEAKWVAAPNDGVGPSLLLTIRRGKSHTVPIQYLVNAPEGFARLVLEHKCRPGPSLRALLLTDLSQAAQGGLAGLLLRLRQDGHSKLRVLGPAGLHDVVDGLSYFVRWTHPTLELSALTSAQQGVVYDDDVVEVRPLWSNCLLWEVPAWLITAPRSREIRDPAEGTTKEEGPRATTAAKRLRVRAKGKTQRKAVADSATATAAVAVAGGQRLDDSVSRPTKRAKLSKLGRPSAVAAGAVVARPGTDVDSDDSSDSSGSSTSSREGGRAVGGKMPGKQPLEERKGDAVSSDALVWLRRAIGQTSAAAAVAARKAAEMTSSGPGGAIGMGNRRVSVATGVTVDDVAALATGRGKKAVGKPAKGRVSGGGKVAVGLSGAQGSVAVAGADDTPSSSDVSEPDSVGGLDSGSCTTSSSAGDGDDDGVTLAGNGDGGVRAGNALARPTGVCRRGRDAAAVAVQKGAHGFGGETSNSSSSMDDGEGGNDNSSTSGEGDDSSSNSTLNRIQDSDDISGGTKRQESSSSSGNSSSTDTSDCDRPAGRRPPPPAATVAAAKRRRHDLPDRTPQGPGPVSEPSGDLFSELDRLFMSSGGATGGATGAGFGLGRPLLGGRATGPSWVRGGHSGRQRGRGGSGMGRRGAEGRPASAAVAVASAAGATGTTSDAAVLRAQVLARLKQQQPGPLTASASLPKVQQPQQVGAQRQKREQRATANGRKPPSLPPRAVSTTGLKPNGGAGPSASTAATRPAVLPPLGYLLYFKDTRQALLVSAPRDPAAADALLSHTVTPLLAAAPPELLMATVHMAPPAVTRRTLYRAWARRLTGSHIWADGGEAAAAIDSASAKKAPTATGMLTVTATAAVAEHPSIKSKTGDAAVHAAPHAVAGAIADVSADVKVEGERTRNSHHQNHPDEQMAGFLEDLRAQKQPPHPQPPHSSIDDASLVTAAPPMRHGDALCGLGFLASCRVSMRLNAVAPGLFPLPYMLRRRMAAAVAGRGSGAAADAVDAQLVAAIDAAAAAAAANGSTPDAAPVAATTMATTTPSKLSDNVNTAAVDQNTHDVSTVSGITATPSRHPEEKENVKEAANIAKGGEDGTTGNLGVPGSSRRALTDMPPEGTEVIVRQQVAAAAPLGSPSRRHFTAALMACLTRGARDDASKGREARAVWWGGLGTAATQDGGGDSGGQDGVECTAGAGSGDLVEGEGGGVGTREVFPDVAVVQKELLEQWRDTGLASMLQDLRRSYPTLTRTREAERYLRPQPRATHTATAAATGAANTATANATAPQPKTETQQQQLSSHTGTLVHHGAYVSMTERFPPPQPEQLPYNDYQNQNQWPGAIGGYGGQNGYSSNSNDGRSSSAIELAAAVAAYGIPDVIGAVMRPSYTVPRSSAASPQPPHPPPYGLSSNEPFGNGGGDWPSTAMTAVATGPPAALVGLRTSILNPNVSVRHDGAHWGLSKGFLTAGQQEQGVVHDQDRAANRNPNGSSAANRNVAQELRERLRVVGSSLPVVATGSTTTTTSAAHYQTVDCQVPSETDTTTNATDNRAVAAKLRLVLNKRLEGGVEKMGPGEAVVTAPVVDDTDISRVVEAAADATAGGSMGFAANVAVAGTEAVKERDGQETPGNRDVARQVRQRLLGAMPSETPTARTTASATKQSTGPAVAAALPSECAATGRALVVNGNTAQSATNREAVNHHITNNDHNNENGGGSSVQDATNGTGNDLSYDGDDAPPPSFLSAASAAAGSTARGLPDGTSSVRHVSILFLGTGSAEPSKYRGSSAVLLRGLGPTRGSLLIDAGEGTFGAMVRWLGRKGALAEVAALAAVWCSHKHPDHVLGLPGLLEARSSVGEAPPLLVVGPQEVADWLTRLAPLHPTWRFTFILCRHFMGSTAATNSPLDNVRQPNNRAGARSADGGKPGLEAAAPQPMGPLLPPPPLGMGTAAPPHQPYNSLWQQACACCPPYSNTSNNGMPYDAWADGGAQGNPSVIMPPPVAPAGRTTGRHPPPSAAARLRWHQQQRRFDAAAAPSATLSAGRTTPHPFPGASLSQPPQPHPYTQHPPASWPQIPVNPVNPSWPHKQPSRGQQPPLGVGAREADVAATAAAVCYTLGLVRWQSVAVHHCRDAWGLVLEHQDGWKIVYSGDTRPCPALVTAGRGATLLIHEATFEPCLEGQARSKRHSTSAEAAAVAEAMGAYRTVLTHFSQRYPRVPAGIQPAALPLRRRPVPAFDGMLLPLTALPTLPNVLPPLALAMGEPPAARGTQLQLQPPL